MQAFTSCELLASDAQGYSCQEPKWGAKLEPVAYEEPPGSGWDRTSTSSTRSARLYLPNKPADECARSVTRRWPAICECLPQSPNPCRGFDPGCQPDWWCRKQSECVPSVGTRPFSLPAINSSERLTLRPNTARRTPVPRLVSRKSNGKHALTDANGGEGICCVTPPYTNFQDTAISMQTCGTELLPRLLLFRDLATIS